MLLHDSFSDLESFLFEITPLCTVAEVLLAFVLVVSIDVFLRELTAHCTIGATYVRLTRCKEFGREVREPALWFACMFVVIEEIRSDLVSFPVLDTFRMVKL